MPEWFEGEEVQNESTIFEPYDISSIPNDFNMNTIYDLINENKIYMPPFQRNYVWDIKRASKFIESLVLNLPIPQVFLWQEAKNSFGVIDGQQRLMTIFYFRKQRFPKAEKSYHLRQVFMQYGNIPAQVLSDDKYFKDFKLTFPKDENGKNHPLSGLKYETLGELQDSYDFMTMRCLAIRQNKPENDDSAIFEIFSRLNTGGMNLTAQEIRACIYHSDFYGMLIGLNENKVWRKLLGKPDPDPHMKDIEFLLRGFAFLCCIDEYKSAMSGFLNLYSKRAKKYSSEEIIYLEQLFVSFLDICKGKSDAIFHTASGRFNVALFESVFHALCIDSYHQQSTDARPFSRTQIDKLKNDEGFIEAITHSTSHTASITTRISKAIEYLQ